MTQFAYRARDMAGGLVTGTLEAMTPDEIRGRLADQGLIPLTVKPASHGLDLSALKNILPKSVKSADLLVMTRQFYTLFKAGMSMEAVLSTLVRQTTNGNLKEALQGIHTAVSAGESLSKAFSQHSKIFGELYISMLAAGEEAGILEEVLKNLCDLIEKEARIKSSVSAALLYPKIVIFVLVVAAIVVMTVVIPKFATFYAHYKAELPVPTQMLMGASNFIRKIWYLLGVFGVGGWIAFRRYAQTARGKLKVGELNFSLPVFGLLNLKVANARFCHILSALYRSGLAMTRALEITGRTIENGAFTKEVDVLRDKVTHGQSLSQGMASCRYFTPVIVDATAVGEKTGSLDEMLEAMGGHYDMEVQDTIKNLTTLLEPILLFLIFGMVTIFALAIFLPIWNISRAVIKH